MIKRSPEPSKPYATQNRSDMTAEIQELLEDNIPKEMIDRHGGTFEKLMRLYALQVAEREIKEAYERHEIVWNQCEIMLSRIKEQLSE